MLEMVQEPAVQTLFQEFPQEVGSAEEDWRDLAECWVEVGLVSQGMRIGWVERVEEVV